MKRGFTLIELLAVITILSLLVLITSMTVANLTKESKDELTITQINLIKAAAKTWGADNVTKLPNGNSCSYLLLKDLKEYGLLDTDLKNPKDKENLPDGLKIRIGSKLNSSGKSILTYEVNPSSISGCTYIGNPIYVDIPTGLTPVIYDGDNWRVPQIDEEWYNYDEQKWANAVVLGKGKTKKPGEIVTVEGDNPDALMMLVYIPRYEYKIEGQYGIHSNGIDGTESLPGEIKVNFIWKGTTTPTSGYHIHPAFSFDGEKDGFWVGKFELSHTTKSKENDADYSAANLNCTTTNCEEAQFLRVLPNMPSLRYNSVSNFFYVIKSIENNNMFGLSNTDLHMMKNSEWGAVAYLSQSKYGKYGNNDYEGAQKEVYINNSSSYYTGRSGGNPGGNTQIKDTYTDQTSTTQYSDYGYYTYDGYLLSYNTNNKTETRDINKGTGASTTGNIYGIYDMSGGAWEYVMGAYGDSEGIYSGYDISSNSEFNGRTGNDNENVINGARVPATKYYDIYSNSTNQNSNDGSESCNNGVCFGHAISEIKGSTDSAGWYGDYTYTPYSIYPWVLRGGFCLDESSAGVFARYSTTGSGVDFVSVRLVSFGK